MAVDAKALQEALEKQKSFILNNLETITLKQLRNKLENELGLQKDDLKPEKNTIGAYVDKLIAEKAAADEAAKKATKQQSDDEDDSNSSDSEEDEKPKKKQKSKPAPAPKAAPRVYSKRVDNLRKICRQATITIPPNIYVKNKTDKELEAALASLLEKNGLDEQAGANEIAKVKQKLQIQRDLEGIDTSNIIEDGPRSRRRAAAERPSYKELLKDAVESDEEEEEEKDDDDDDNEDSDGGEESDDGREESDASGEEEEASASEEEEQDDKDNEKVVEKRVSPLKRSKDSEKSEPLKEISENNMSKRARVADWSDDDE